MIKRLLRHDETAVAAIEMAVALPVIILFIYGIFILGVAFQAKAGMQNALGEGARYATLYPTPTNDQIKTRISAKVFGVGIGTFDAPTVTSATGYKTLTVSFRMTPDFIFFTVPEVHMTQTKRVYTAT